MVREIKSKINTAKGEINIYTEKKDGRPEPRWFAVITLPGGILFPMIERNEEISEEEVLRMI